MSKDSRFDFYEVVVVSAQHPLSQGNDDCRGAILGKSQAESSEWFYAVHIFASNECCSIRENDLASSGEKMSRENFYDGSSLRVTVDPKTGEGKLGKG